MQGKGQENRLGMAEITLVDKEPLRWSSEDAIPREAGVYAIFLPDVSVAPKGWQAGLRHKRNLLYIGKGETGLMSRVSKHFAGKDSSNSSFRKSVGAMLRTTLDLKPIYRKEGQREERNYSFRQEELLSNWIQEHCTFTFDCMRPEYTEKKEYELIKIHNPPLNIMDNEQFCHQKLRRARIECIELAKDSLDIGEDAIDKFPCNTLRHCWNDGAGIPNKKGLLAIFLKEGKEHEQAIPKEWRKELIDDDFIRNNRLLYIGFSGKLRERLEQYFSHSSIDMSAFHNSVCAMLCVSENTSISAFEKARYRLHDEKILPTWIREHCTFAYCEHEEEINKRKKELIEKYTPPLNYSTNPYPHPLLKRHMKQMKNIGKNSPSMRENMTNKFPCYAQSHCWDNMGGIPDKKGFLAIFLKEGEEHERAVPEDWRKELITDDFIRNDRLLYIGEANVLTRLESHFSAKRSTRDTFRRSIGAMLHRNLNLKPTGANESGQYHFCDEETLSDWMQRHCVFAYWKHGLEKKEASKKKKKIIEEYTPPFNIENNKKSCHPKLRKARSECLELAGK